MGGVGGRGAVQIWQSAYGQNDPIFSKSFFCVSQRLFHCRSSSSKRSSKSKEENREEDRIIYLELNFFFSLVLSVFSAVFSPSLFWHFTTIRTNKIITDAATVEKQKIQLQTQGCTGGMKDRKQHLKNWNKKKNFFQFFAVNVAGVVEDVTHISVQSGTNLH